MWGLTAFIAEYKWCSLTASAFTLFNAFSDSSTHEKAGGENAGRLKKFKAYFVC
jgi:hypothetical protein